MYAAVHGSGMLLVQCHMHTGQEASSISSPPPSGMEDTVYNINLIEAIYLIFLCACPGGWHYLTPHMPADAYKGSRLTVIFILLSGLAGKFN